MATRATITGIRLARVAGLAALLAAGTACDEGVTVPASRPPVRAVDAVEVTADLTMLTVGGTAQARATVVDADRVPLADRPVEWSSSDPSIATVSARGVVTARAAGTAAITAASGGKSGAVWVSVAAPVVHAVRITPVDTVLEVGSSRALRAVALDAAGAEIPGLAVRWHSSDTSAVSIDDAGRVTALREGIQVVNAEIGGMMGWARIVVPPDLSGTWELNVYDLVDGKTRCWVRGVELTLERDGLAVTGMAGQGAGGVRTGCDITGTEGPFSTPMPPHGPLAGELVPNVYAAHLDLSIAFESDRWALKGMLHAGFVSGPITLAETVNGQEVVRKGTFSLQRRR